MSASPLVVTPTFHPEKVGTPHYVSDLVEEWQRVGIVPRVVTQQPYYPRFERFEGYGRAARRDTFGSSPVHRLPTIVPREGRVRWRAVSESNFVMQVAIGRISGALSRSSAVLAVSPGVPLAVVAGNLLRAPGGRLVALVHDIAFGLAAATAGSAGSRLAEGVRRAEVRALNLADVVAVLTESMGDALQAAGVRTQIEVVPLWPTVAGGPVTNVSRIGQPTVMYSGSLGRKQGLDRLLDLAEGLRERHASAVLVIRGEGSERSRLAALAASRGLTNVEFCPFVPVDGLAASLAEATVHVVPQLPDGARYAVPSKIYNILAVGRPVVVTALHASPLGALARDVPAVRAVDPGEPAALLDAVVELLENPGRREKLGEAARAHIERSMGREGAARRLLKLLEG